MFRAIRILALVAGCAVWASAASAGVYSDDLGKCLVKSTSDADQIALIKWIFGAMALHPDVQPYSKITDAERDGFNHQAADLVVKLLTVDCRKESVLALKYEGNAAIESSFALFGEAAMRGLLNNPQVQQDMSKFGDYADKQKLRDLALEAGQAPPAK